MREIKFRFWHKENGGMFSDMKTELCDVNDIFQDDDFIYMQYTGLKDKNGKEIYFDDFLNVYFTSNNGENIHDCIYQVKQGVLGLELHFVKLLWESEGHNQYPTSSTLCERYKTLEYGFTDRKLALRVCDTWGKNELQRHTWKNQDASDYFEIIGNIYENPELLEQQPCKQQ